MLMIDAAIESPTHCVTLTPRNPATTARMYYTASKQVWKRLRRAYGRVEYFGRIEFTTGLAETSGGFRRMHGHYAVKGLAGQDAGKVEHHVREVWRNSLAGYGDEAELGPANRLVDLMRPPIVECRHALRTGDVLLRLDRNRVHRVEQIRLFDARDDADPFGRLDRGFLDARELEHDSLLAAYAAEAAPHEELERIGVALTHLELDAALAKVPCAGRDVREQRGADASAPSLRHDRDVPDCELRPRLDEAAADRLLAEAREQVDQIRVGRPVEPQNLDRRPDIGVNAAANGNQRLEVRVGLGRRKHEL